jgi:hypothetical protein
MVTENVTLRALSKHYGPMSGGGEIHVVGSPFIKGPSLKCVFRTPHGEVNINLDNIKNRVVS